MDNRVFNYRGRTKAQFMLAFKLALLDEYGREQRVSSWEVDTNKGLIFNWVSSRGNAFLMPLNAETAAEMAWDWLQSDEAKKIQADDGGGSYINDCDVSNELGFRIYNETWGHVGTNQYAIIAIRPSYCWYGK